jgi:hypothetical protein
MKYELIFNKEIYNKQMDLLFDLAWKKKISYYKKSQYVAVFLMFVGLALIYERPNIFGVGYLSVFFGLSLLLPFTYYYLKIRSAYKNKEISRKKDHNLSIKEEKITLELTEKSMIFSVEDFDTILDWNGFATYLVKEDNLILITKADQPYIVGENEVGHENFQQILSFVEGKLKTK